MQHAGTEGADRALRQWVRAGRTLVEAGEELAWLRREQGLSPEALARRTRLPATTIRTLESGSRRPTMEEFARLAAGLGLTAGPRDHSDRVNATTAGIEAGRPPSGHGPVDRVVTGRPGEKEGSCSDCHDRRWRFC